MTESRLPRLLREGQALDEQKRYTEALAVYERIVHVSPNDAEAAERTAYVLLCLKRYEEALNAFDRALVLQPDSGWLTALRAKTLFYLKRYTEADDTIDQALVLSPNYAYAHLTKSYIARELKRDEDALAHVAVLPNLSRTTRRPSSSRRPSSIGSNATKKLWTLMTKRLLLRLSTSSFGRTRH